MATPEEELRALFERILGNERNMGRFFDSEEWMTFASERFSTRNGYMSDKQLELVQNARQSLIGEALDNNIALSVTTGPTGKIRSFIDIGTGQFRSYRDVWNLVKNIFIE